MDVVAIVPAHDEEQRVAATVEALLAVEAITEVIVVDDGSTDETGARAEASGAAVIRLPHNRGKGAALRAGINATEARALCFIDADLEATASAATVLIAPVIAGTADMVIAAPVPTGPSGFGLVEQTARWGIEKLTGATMRRPLSGQRALRREVVERCGIADRFGVETALTIDALRAGFRVIEVTADIEHAKTTRDAAGFVHRARQGLDVTRVLASRVLNRT